MSKRIVQFDNPFGHDTLIGVVTSEEGMGRLLIHVTTPGFHENKTVGIYEDDIHKEWT